MDDHAQLFQQHPNRNMGKSSRFGDVGGRRQGKNSLKNSNHEYGNGADAKIRFRRLKARVGSQYQTRVAKAVPASAAEQNRPSPLLMSTEYPFVAQDIVNQHRLEMSETGKDPPLVSVSLDRLARSLFRQKGGMRFYE